MNGDLALRPRITLPSRFQNQKTIGSTPVSELVRARDRRSGRLVAIKTLYPIDWLTAEENVARYKRMRDALQPLVGITHPVLAEIYELGECNGAFYLSREYIQTPSIKSIEAPPSVEAARTIAAQVANAL